MDSDGSPPGAPPPATPPLTLADVTLDDGCGMPPFEQLRTQIASRIAAGSLPAGTKLPTVRALSEQLGVAPNTVARAYRELEGDGVIATHGRRGTFVSCTVLAGHDTDASAAAEAFVDAVRRSGLTLAEATRLVEQAWPR